MEALKIDDIRSILLDVGLGYLRALPTKQMLTIQWDSASKEELLVSSFIIRKNDKFITLIPLSSLPSFDEQNLDEQAVSQTQELVTQWQEALVKVCIQ